MDENSGFEFVSEGSGYKLYKATTLMSISQFAEKLFRLAKKENGTVAAEFNDVLLTSYPEMEHPSHIVGFYRGYDRGLKKGSQK